jgi:hypothetical protein
LTKDKECGMMKITIYGIQLSLRIAHDRIIYTAHELPKGETKDETGALSV